MEAWGPDVVCVLHVTKIKVEHECKENKIATLL